MLRRTCACLALFSFLLQTGATAYACALMAGSGAHGDHGVMTMASSAAGAAQDAAPSGGDRKRVVASDGASMPDHCNRFHRADCPHQGGALHPCPSDQVAGPQAVDAGLPLTPEALVFELDARTRGDSPDDVSPPARAVSPQLPPPRTA
jgi:hypothetical protein